ncbi:hypothetical protein M9H77_18517 [Catharanthus roseus]|uniref:Uncharacterized protein n=1 Tax=Catharanthus roseus TaxID=4058 RepID=A0ACC0B7R6_CATRO|nr:hypothetical protein M9H77_18517 [Catharanthus roseus]
MWGERSRWERLEKKSSGDVTCIPPMMGNQVHIWATNKRKMDLSEGDTQQRRDLFNTHCRILDKTCSLVIDCGSCTNLVSSYVIEK